MATKTGIVLRHKESGMFYSYMADHTTKLWSAWRFDDHEYLQIWLQNHGYAPKNPSEYEAIDIEITIKIAEVEK